MCAATAMPKRSRAAAQAATAVASDSPSSRGTIAAAKRLDEPVVAVVHIAAQAATARRGCGSSASPPAARTSARWAIQIACALSGRPVGSSAMQLLRARVLAEVRPGEREPVRGREDPVRCAGAAELRERLLQHRDRPRRSARCRAGGARAGPASAAACPCSDFRLAPQLQRLAAEFHRPREFAALAGGRGEVRQGRREKVLVAVLRRDLARGLEGAAAHRRGGWRGRGRCRAGRRLDPRPGRELRARRRRGTARAARRPRPRGAVRTVRRPRPPRTATTRSSRFDLASRAAMPRSPCLDGRRGLAAVTQ